VRRWWWLTFAAFFLIGTAWALALPANGSYDEKDHIVRAYAVATGQLTTDRTIVDRRTDTKFAFLVPAGLLPSNATVDCPWSPRPAKTPACQRWLTGTQKVLTPSGAARYSPVYYLPVGIPLALWPNLTGLLLARVLSALLCAALLACAVTAALRLGSRLLVVGVVLAATPLATNLFGAVNPNGLEIAAGILVFCSLLALLRAPRGAEPEPGFGGGEHPRRIAGGAEPEPGFGGGEHPRGERLDGRSTRRLLALAALGSVLLLTVRQIGPVWLVLDLVACVLLARPGRLAALWRRRDARWLLGGSWVVGLAFAVGWLAFSGLGDVASNNRDALHYGFGEALRRILFERTTSVSGSTPRVPFYVEQVIGSFDYGETHLSKLAIVGWYLLAAAVVVPCLALASRRYMLVLTGLGLASAVVLVLLDLYFLPKVGWFSQGRYAMPSLVGVLLGAAAVSRFEGRLAERGWLRWYALALAGAAALGHLYALSRVMSRFQVGIDAPLNPFAYTWRPPVGPVPPLLVMLVGAALLVLLAVAARPTGTGTRAGAAEPAGVTSR
jgi:hypothetical protein